MSCASLRLCSIKHSACDVGSSPHWASAVEGHEPHKEDWDDSDGKLRLSVCLYPTPREEEGLIPSVTCALLPVAVQHHRTVSGPSHPLEEADVWLRSQEGCMFVVSQGLCFKGCFGP